MRDTGRAVRVFAARAPAPLALGVLCAAAAAPLAIMLLAALRDGTWHAAGTPPFLAIGLALAVTAAVGLSLRRRDVQLTPTHLVVRASLFTRRVPLSDLELARARRVDLAEHAEYKAWLKKRGLSLPGFHAGTFRMRGGGTAFYLVSGTRDVLVLPTRNGPTLVLALESPTALLDALRGMVADDVRR